jgi:hypothetical protein
VEKSPVFLVGRDGAAVAAELWDDISDEHLDLWTSSWTPQFEAAKNRFKDAGLPPERQPPDIYWNWREFVTKTRPYLTYRRFALVAENTLQGLMIASLSNTSRIESQKGKDLVYAELISTAPWNRKDAVNASAAPQLSGVGVVMVRVAIELSKAEGLKGRIGLHSLGQSEGFYRERCKMTDLGLDRAKRMVYFEMTEKQAAAFAAEE